jgi:hypothetical protein
MLLFVYIKLCLRLVSDIYKRNMCPRQCQYIAYVQTYSHINSRRGLQRGKRERPRFVFGKPWGLFSILIKRKQTILNTSQYHTQYHTSQLVFVALGIWYFIPRVNIGNPKLIETDCDPFWAHVQVVQYNIKSSNLPYPAILRMIKCQALSAMEFTVQPAVGLLKLWLEKTVLL